MVQRVKAILRAPRSCSACRGYEQAAKESTRRGSPEVDATSKSADAAAATSHEESTRSRRPASTLFSTKHCVGRKALDQRPINIAASRITHNSRGRRTSINNRPVPRSDLVDMEALSLPIPVAFRWVLAYCALHAPATAQVDGEV